MNAQAKLRMEADEFIAWAMDRPDGKRYELVAGEIVPMAAERVGHNRVKQRAWLALTDALRAARLEGEVFGDGMSVRVEDQTVYEPDCTLRIGPALTEDIVQISEPMIVIEVVSPSTHGYDSGAKLQDYFRLDSVRHYLIVDGRTRTVTHHARQDDGIILTRLIRSGDLALAPPGLTVPLAALFQDLR